MVLEHECFKWWLSHVTWRKYLSVLETWGLWVGTNHHPLPQYGSEEQNSWIALLQISLRDVAAPCSSPGLDYFSHSNFFPGAEALILSYYLRCMDYLDNFIFIPESGASLRKPSCHLLYGCDVPTEIHLWTPEPVGSELMWDFGLWLLERLVCVKWDALIKAHMNKPCDHLYVKPGWCAWQFFFSEEPDLLLRRLIHTLAG